MKVIKVPTGSAILLALIGSSIAALSTGATTLKDQVLDVLKLLQETI